MQQSAAQMMRDVFQEVGVVLETTGERLLVETPSGRFPARKAVSCLVAPEVDDHVLVAVPGERELYVLAVLTRPTEAPLRLSMDRDAMVEAHGTLSLGGLEGVEIRSPGTVATSAREVRIDAARGSLHFERMSYVGRAVEAHTESIKGVLGSLDTWLERATQHVKRSYRYVEEIDMVHAQEADYRADETFSIRSRNAFIRSKELVKVLAAQIHLA